jgi:nucleoside-diphosphate-sugar epimerase
MRVFVAGASGAIGRRLVAQLVAAGHQVIGTFVSAGRDQRIRALGAEPVALDVLDAPAVREAVLKAHPDAIIHEATALASMRWSRSLDRSFARTNRIRTEGTGALLAAAREAGVRRFIAQSFASYRYAREGGWCGCRKLCHLMRPAYIHGSARRSGLAAECAYRLSRWVGVCALRAGSAAVSGAAGACCSDRCTRSGLGAGAVRR